MAPNVRLEPLVSACLLLHVNTQNPRMQFFSRSSQGAFLSYNVFLRVTSSEIKKIFLEFFYVMSFN